MKYFQLMSGTFEVGSFFTFEAKHFYMSQLDFNMQRQILWSKTDLADGKVIDLETIKFMLSKADTNLH